MNTRLFLSLAIAAALLSGCGGDGAPVDGGPDTDAAMPDDAAVASDAAPDSGTDADVMLPDGGPDGGMMMDDGGTDGGPDAGCTSNAQCQNGDLCDGEETCEAGGCVPATTPLTCNDLMDCTTDSCAPATGCVYTPLDADGDGDGACTDCDDSNAAIRAGATEVCNAIDDDCNGLADDGLTSTLYPDCDADGWAEEFAPSVTACVAPTPASTGCSTPSPAWTSREPMFGDYDCGDADPRAHSMTTAYHTTPIMGGFGDFDFDCDFVEDPQYPTQGSCVSAGAACTATPGWVLADVPVCGSTAAFIASCTAVCTPTIETRTQGCR